MYSELYTKIGKRKEAVGIVETLLIFPMAALYFSVVTGCIGADQFVPDPKTRGGQLKASKAAFPVGRETIGKLNAIVSLYTHSTRTPRRLNQAAIFSRKSAEE